MLTARSSVSLLQCLFESLITTSTSQMTIVCPVWQHPEESTNPDNVLKRHPLWITLCGATGYDNSASGSGVSECTSTVIPCICRAIILQEVCYLDSPVKLFQRCCQNWFLGGCKCRQNQRQKVFTNVNMQRIFT
ncbi:hypothetical protein ILYODFUR_011185 [Ilyodon furcidens]|uniref:Secreted protein n=1 Tax=Ilyodon furcidens TaxID=33524 RepID=A0ABV0U761_9TELE